MKIPKKEYFSAALAATAAAAVLAIGLSSTAQAAPVVIFQGDLNGSRGTANTGPVQPGWTGISGTNTTAPWTNTYTINGITIDLSAGSGNTGWRNDRTQLTVPNVGPLAPMFNSSVFASGGFDVKMTGLTAGTTYNFIFYGTDTGNNVGDVHWYYSLAGDKSNPVDAGWINQPGSTAFTPTANTGITLGTKGIAMLSTTFTATGPVVDFFSTGSTVAVLSGLELYATPVGGPLAADAGADKTVSPSTPSVTIGAGPTATGGTGPYTYSWSPATGLSSDTVSNPTASPGTTTTYTVTVTDSLSATASDSVTVSYPLVAAAGADKLCTPSSTSATIGATSTANGGTGPYTYLWSPSTDLNDATVANPVASPSTTTTYTVTVTDSLSATSSDSVVVTYAVPDPNLISVDFIYSDATGGPSKPFSGNTTLTGTTNKNAAGEIYTGQVGLWNAMNVGTNNSSKNTASLTNLMNGAGVATTVAFKMGIATNAGSSGGNWRNNYVAGLTASADGVLRQEVSQVYYPALTLNHFNWELTGLAPNGHYRLTLFGNGSNSFTNIANTVAGTLDTENDWNWSDIAADGSGVIAGNYLTTGNNQVFGIYGLQIYKLVTPLAANAGPDKGVSAGVPTTQIGGSPTANGGTDPYTYLWSPTTGLDDPTLANPTASPGTTTTYTVTVTDSTSPTPATATDSVLVAFTAPPLVADAGPDKSLTPSAPSAQIGGSPSASGAFPPYTYSWTPSNSLDDPSAANPVASPSSPTTYTLTVTDAQSTQTTDTVTVNYPLVVDAGVDQIVTPGSPSVQIGGSPLTYGGTPPFIYSWTPSTGLDDATVANPTASPTTTTTYTVQVTDSLSVVVSDEVTVTYSVPNDNLISVDFKEPSGTTCVGNTTLTGTTMKNAVGNVFTGQVGNWNALNIGTYGQNSAISGFLNNAAGTATTVKLALGLATGLDNTAAGAWRCDPNEGAPGGPDALRSEKAYLYYPALTGDHFAWALTGLAPNGHYRLTLFGSGTNTFTNIANSAAGVPDTEGDWNWEDITADSSGVILGTLLTNGNNQTNGLYGVQIESLGTPPSGYATWADTYAGGGTAEEDYNNDGVENGIAYFMGMNGLATNPGVVGGSVTWPYVNAVSSYKVQTSNDLSSSGWTDVLPGDPRLHDTGVGGSVIYDLLPPGPSKLFVRIVVTP
jgi:hypothetical protein